MLANRLSNLFRAKNVAQYARTLVARSMFPHVSAINKTLIEESCVNVPIDLLLAVYTSANSHVVHGDYVGLWHDSVPTGE